MFGRGGACCARPEPVEAAHARRTAASSILTPARSPGITPPSVNDLSVEGLVETFEVRNLQLAHGLDRQVERFVGTTVPADGPSRGPQDAEDLRSIEPLSFTMLAEAHGSVALAEDQSGTLIEYVWPSNVTTRAPGPASTVTNGTSGFRPRVPLT